MGAADTRLVTEQADDLVADSLAAAGLPERVHYAAGVLLGAEDFAAEQLYHRARTGRALAALHGFGTVAGLRVSCPAHDNPELEVQVAPGVALDRLGRLIEVRRVQCIHLTRWLAQRESLAATALERIDVIDAVREDTPGLQRLVFDVFLRFAVCPRGRTPAFAAGPFNATDYVVPSRLGDGCEITLQLAHVVGESAENPKGTLALPRQRSQALQAQYDALQGLSDPLARAAAQRLWHMESALDAWPTPAPTDPTRLPRLAEHASDADWDKVLLARVSLPVRQADASGFPTVDGDALAAVAAQPQPPQGAVVEPRWRDLADNALRPIVFNPHAWRGAL